MATLQITIQPLEVPETVRVKIPGNDDPIDVLVEDLDEDTVAELLEDFSVALMNKVGK